MIPVVFCLNNNYALPAAAALYSLLDNSSQNEGYELHIVHSDITQDNQDKLQQIVQRFEFAKLSFVNIHGRFDKVFQKLPSQYFSADLFSKLIISSLFPQYDKMIVSDVDVIFLRDVAPLYYGYTEDTYLSANNDFRKNKKPMQYPEHIIKHFTLEEQYIIQCHHIPAGLMVYNLKRMREDNVEEKLLDLLERHVEHLYLPEQEILTLCCYDNVSRLPNEAMYFFHTTEENPLENPILVQDYELEEVENAIKNIIQWHYIGSMKPWLFPKAYKANEFYKYIVQTPFAYDYFKHLYFLEFKKKYNLEKFFPLSTLPKRIVKKIMSLAIKILSKLSFTPIAKVELFDGKAIHIFGLPVFKTSVYLDKDCYTCTLPCTASKKYSILNIPFFTTAKKNLSIGYVEYYVLKTAFRNYNKNDIRIQKFLEGFDDKSKEYASFVISTLEKLRRLNCLGVEVFDSNAFEAHQRVLDNFYDSIEKLEDGTFKFKNYVSVINFSPSVFIENHSLDDIESKSCINGKIIIDVGGYVGDSAMIFSKNFPASTIYSFEVIPENMIKLKKNLKLNNITNVKLVPYALGDFCGKAYISNMQSSSTIANEESSNALAIDMQTLDNYVEENTVSNIGLIKVDIEGFEQSFIRGATHTIKKFKPILMLSIYHNWDDFINIKAMIEDLNMGYTFKLVKPTDGNLFLETLLICE